MVFMSIESWNDRPRVISQFSDRSGPRYYLGLQSGLGMLGEEAGATIPAAFLTVEALPL